MTTNTLNILINSFIICLGVVCLMFMGKIVYYIDNHCPSQEELNWNEIDIVTTCEGTFTIIRDSSTDPE